MVLFLHHRYRTTGGEDRAVDDLLWLAREHLGLEAELLARDSATLGRTRAAAGLVGGGLAPDEVARAVRRTGAAVVHAHNVQPTWGWRALAAARGAGARVVLHLHNYRLVCAAATCFTRGADCVRCHGRDTRPGVRLGCRGNPAEVVAYAAGISLWQRRILDLADEVVVPSPFALERLRRLGAPLDDREVAVVPGFVREFASESRAERGGYAVIAGRLAREKGVDAGIAACARARLPLRVAGDGPLEADLRAGADGDVEFLGHLDRPALRELLDGAALALVPTRAPETYGLAAAEAMAAGVPVVGSRIGALTDLLAPEDLVPPGDVPALAQVAARRYGDEEAGNAALVRARERASADAAADALASVYRLE